MSEAFRKIIYIIRLFFTNKLSESFKKVLYNAKIYFITDMRVPKLLLFHQDNKSIKLKQRHQRNDTIENK